MEDIAPALLEQIQQSFQERAECSGVLKSILAKIENGSASYEDVHRYAIEAGELLAAAFREHLSSDVLPDGRMYFNIAQRVVAEPLTHNYELVSDVAVQVQEQLNRAAGLGLKAVQPALNQDKILGIVNRLSSEARYDDVAWLLDAPVVNFTQSVADDFVRENANFQYQAGLNPKIIRTLKGKGCAWCRALAGVYDYEDVSDKGNDVFRRHENCKCTVVFDPGDGRRQNVHTKRWDDADADTLSARKRIGLDITKLNPSEAAARQAEVTKALEKT